MNILHINKYYVDVVGGVERHLYDIISVQKNRCQVTVLVANTRLRTETVRQGGVEIIKVASFGKLFSAPLAPTFPLWLKRLAKHQDILHFHLPYPISVISYLMVRPVGNVIATYHNDIVRQRFLAGLLRAFGKSFFRRVDRIIVTSPQMAHNSKTLRQFSSKCRVIPLGINLSSFKRTKLAINVASEIKRDYGAPLILFVGRLVTYKGLEYLVHAMKDVSARLLIAGSGPLDQELKKLTEKLSITNKIHFLGEVSETQLVALYYASDLFVLPSINSSEGYGLVQLEAHACGKPVISTDIPTGVSFVNKNEKTGLIVRSRRAEDLTRAINYLLNHPELSKQYGAYARERVKSLFTRERMGTLTEKLYREVIS